MKNLLRVWSMLVIVVISAFSLVTSVKGTTKVQEGGWYPKYNAVKNKVAFHQEGPDGDMEVYVMAPDGTNQVRITDNTPGKRHKGQPYWHPSGDYIIFTAEQDGYKRFGECQGLCEQPGLGRNNNVWIMKADGSKYWKMTNVPENGAHIRPSFSHDGTKVFWLEEYTIYIDPEGKGCTWRRYFPRVPGEEYCSFRIVWGDFAFQGEKPSVSNIHRIVLPGLHILEGSGFSRDDQRIIFDACNPAEVEAITGQYTCKYGGDIYTVNLEGGELTRITNDPLQNTENEEYSPDGTRLAYYRAADEPGTPGDWYVMSADGIDYPGTRVTFFSDPDSPDYIQNVFGGEGDWLDSNEVIISVGRSQVFKLYSGIYTVLTDTPPTVTIANPADGATVADTITIRIDATDVEDAAGTLKVEWNVDGGAWQPATYNGGTGYYEASWDTSTVSDGSHTVNARATDSAGNTGSDSNSVAVDNLDGPPTVSIVSPPDGSTVSGVVTIQADATDDRGVTQVEFFVDGVSSIGVDTNGDDGWSVTWDSTSVGDGTHTVTATATDTAGQTASDGIGVTVGNLAPGTVHVSDLDGTNSTVGKSGWKATVTIMVHDVNHGPVASATVSGTWSGGASGSGSCTTDAGGQCSVTSSKISNSQSSATLTVANVSHATLLYEPAHNHDPDGNSDGTSITVAKP